MPAVFSAACTTDVDRAVAMIRAVADHRPRVRILDAATAAFDVRTATFGEYGVDRIRMRGIRYRGEAAPTPLLFAGMMKRGRGRFRSTGVDVELTAGCGFLGPVDIAYHAEYDDPAFTVVRLTMPYVASTAEQVLGIAANDFRFLSHTPSSAGAGERWNRLIDFVVTELGGDDEGCPPALMVDELFRLTATTSLTTFANSGLTTSYLSSAGRVAPAVVRRAVAFMDANAGAPITTADIAAAAGIGLRALQEGFRRHLGLTPTAYLRRVRLERAHRDLQAADSTAGVTVNAIARRWGFTSHGRFTAHYRAVYGRTPSHTLRG